MEELCKAFSQAKHQPTAIIAKTFKGRGISGPYARVSLLPPLGMGPVAEWVGAPMKGGISLRSCVWGGCSSECTLAGDSVVSMAEPRIQIQARLALAEGMCRQKERRDREGLWVRGKETTPPPLPGWHAQSTLHSPSCLP